MIVFILNINTFAFLQFLVVPAWETVLVILRIKSIPSIETLKIKMAIEPYLHFYNRLFFQSNICALKYGARFV